jgi:hypothetical protein
VSVLYRDKRFIYVLGSCFGTSGDLYNSRIQSSDVLGVVMNSCINMNNPEYEIMSPIPNLPAQY